MKCSCATWLQSKSTEFPQNQSIVSYFLIVSFAITVTVELLQWFGVGGLGCPISSRMRQIIFSLLHWQRENQTMLQQQKQQQIIRGLWECIKVHSILMGACFEVSIQWRSVLLSDTVFWLHQGKRREASEWNLRIISDFFYLIFAFGCMYINQEVVQQRPWWIHCFGLFSSFVLSAMMNVILTAWS